MPATDFQSLLSDANVACYQNASDDDFLLLELALLEQIVLTLNPSATTDPQSLLNIAQNLVPPGSPNPASYLNLPPGFFNVIQLALLQDIVLNIGAGSTWDPSTPIAGATLIEWLKGDALTGASGSSISDWPASTGVDAVQGGSAAQPTVLTGTYFHPVARFNGTSDILDGNGFTGSALPVTLAIFFAYQGSLSAASTIIDFGTAAGPPNTGTSGSQFVASAGSSVNLQASDNAPHILFITFNGATSKYAFDGGPLITISLGTNAVSNLILGALANISNFSQVDIGEILIWSGDASASYTNIFNYLYNRWFFQP